MEYAGEMVCEEGDVKPLLAGKSVIKAVKHRKTPVKRLRPWLLEQIDSGIFPGLCWEDEAKTTFRIPWKHAGKNDYSLGMHGAIFKAWALNRGKFSLKEELDPSALKTRLRCALNKSSDFAEVSERSQLDTDEAYKVYRVLPEDSASSSGSPGGGDKRLRLDHDYGGRSFYEQQARAQRDGTIVEIKSETSSDAASTSYESSLCSSPGMDYYRSHMSQLPSAVASELGELGGTGRATHSSTCPYTHPYMHATRTRARSRAISYNTSCAYRFGTRPSPAPGSVASARRAAGFGTRG